MPIHDWTKVGANTFHHFHSLWIGGMSNALNELLPPKYYAMAEQHAAGGIADVLTLEECEPPGAPNSSPRQEETGGVALLEAPPKVSIVEQAGSEYFANIRRTLTVRRAGDDHVVSMVEVLSPGNKTSQEKLHDFIHKAYEAFSRGIHLLVIDLLPPGSFDPQGIHTELRRELGFEKETAQWPIPAKPLTLAAYDAGELRAYVEPLAVGEKMIDMPLFLQPRRYIHAPLEQTYLAAYKGVPQRWKRVIEGA